jgi:hypothetical protein
VRLGFLADATDDGVMYAVVGGITLLGTVAGGLVLRWRAASRS